MKIDLKFIPQNTALKGVKNIGLYDSDGNKLKNIPLGNLTPKSKGNKLYTFGAISDVHLPYSTGTDDFVRALNYLNNKEKVDFICISGDMGSAGTDDEWASYKNYVDTYSPNTPVHISAGNHDAGQSVPKTYEYPITYTGNPLYYSFTQGDDVFIIFGMSLWGNPPFSKESLQWLYETLEANRNKRCFVFQHMMRMDGCGNAHGKYSFDGLDNTHGKVFLSLMEHYTNVLWFHGHSHTEFNLQSTLPSPIANYDRKFGCHSIHVPSLAVPRDKNATHLYSESEGHVVDVYKNGIHLRGRDFVREKFLPIASYWIDTKLAEIKANTYSDPYGVIDTNSEEVKPSVNIVPTLLDTDLTNVFNGIGYKENARVNSSGEVVDLGVEYKTTVTGLIPLGKDGDVLHVRGTDRVTYIDGRHNGWCSLWDSTGAFLEYRILLPEALVNTDENGDFAITIDYTALKVNNHPTASYIRLQVGEVTDKLIITRNQLID